MIRWVCTVVCLQGMSTVLNYRIGRQYVYYYYTKTTYGNNGMNSMLEYDLIVDMIPSRGWGCIMVTVQA